MRVEVSGQIFDFPHRCACCGGPANSALSVSASKTTGKKVVHTKTSTWNIPYCSACIKHVDAARAAARATLWTVGVALVAGAFAGYQYSGVLGWSLVLLGITGAVALYSKLMAAARRRCTDTCVCVCEAAAFRGWQGSLNVFEFLSRDYALEFMVANQKKLVNLSPEASQFLANRGRQKSN
jgi:hypothetical protein